jgi:hypothetical protein
MPTEPVRLSLAALLCAALFAPAAQAQTDDTVPFYAGVAAGVTHVSNVYRVGPSVGLPAGTVNSDNVTTAALLAGVDKRLGRQHLKVDGTLQDNRYADNPTLNNSAYTLRAALNWETAGDLSGTVSAQNNRSLAQFNLGSGAELVTGKNLERSQEYGATVRLGVASRYSIEAGVNRRSRDFSAEQYDRFVYSQHTTSLGAYAKPGGNVRFGLVARRTEGDYPRYPLFFANIRVGTMAVDYVRDDIDLTANWSTGGSSQLFARVSTSRARHDPNNSPLRDFNATTGVISGSWQPTGKIKLGLQFARDTGQELLISNADVNRVYNSWQFNGDYALTGKLSLNASASNSRNQRDDGGFDKERSHGLGLRWAITRSLSLSCQYNHAARDSSVLQYAYSANSYGCTGQALVF